MHINIWIITTPKSCRLSDFSFFYSSTSLWSKYTLYTVTLTIQTATDLVLFNCNLQSSPTIPQRLEFLDCNKTHVSARKSLSASCGIGLVSLLFPADTRTHTKHPSKHSLFIKQHTDWEQETASDPSIISERNSSAVTHTTKPDTHSLATNVHKIIWILAMLQWTKLPEISYSNFGP